ncbi:MAG TPA: LysR family transcriptional regulator [Ktedonobacteraceae bacterium]|jgi:DNA-binding transcriptional LysR family regulator|nr:LysR family transcriptional regulator [Ktedonobacteraceae bacterium]
MDIDQLQAFERIVREGSFSRAARQLNITQPTISARIQNLEAEVGGPLFVRGGRRLDLTERGESFLSYARRALEIVSEGIEAARLSEEGQRGRITVGTLPSLASGFLAESILEFHDTHPQVDFFVRTGHSEEVIEMLYDGRVRLGLVSWPCYNPDLAELLHFREPLVLVVPANSGLARQGKVTLEQVKKARGHLLIVHWGPSARDFIARISEQAGPMTALPIETIRYMLLHDLGAAFLTRAIVAEELHAGKLVEVEVEDLPPGYRESALVCLKRSMPLNKLLQDFVDEIDAQAKDARVRSY